MAHWLRPVLESSQIIDVQHLREARACVRAEPHEKIVRERGPGLVALVGIPRNIKDIGHLSLGVASLLPCALGRCAKQAVELDGHDFESKSYGLRQMQSAST